MRLLTAAASPFGRKCHAAALARGVDVTVVPTNPHTSPAELLAVNPLSKIPVLVLADGTAIYDSPVICEYLDGLGDAPALIPPAGAARLKVGIMQALADGIMEAAVVRRAHIAYPFDEGRTAYDQRQKAAVERALAVMETAPPSPLPQGALPDLGAIAAACALGYLDFRYAQEPWRPAHPKLAAWFASVEGLPPLAGSAPA